jgi:hypothetical protein
VAIRKDVLFVVRFQYNAAGQATWGPVINLMDDPLRLGPVGSPRRTGFQPEAAIVGFAAIRKCLVIQKTASRLALLHGDPVSKTRRCHEVVPWQTMAAFGRLLWKNVAVRGGAVTVFDVE